MVFTRIVTKLAAAGAAVLVLTSCVDMFFGAIDMAEKGFDRVAPMSFWKEKAEAGDPEAQYFYGKSFCCGKRPIYDNHTAMEWFCKAAAQNHRDALYQIGHLYENAHLYEGFVLPRDTLIAYGYYSRAVQMGSEAAKFRKEKLKIFLTEEQKENAKIMLGYFPKIPCGTDAVTKIYKKLEAERKKKKEEDA